MNPRLVCAVVLLSITGASCDYGDRVESPGSAPTFEPATAIIETDDGPVMVDIDVADTDEERARGLMHRKSLDDDAGMLFLFFEPSTSGFWMKNTSIPLSIAFFDRDGEILKILDMTPCKTESCPLYDAGVEYFGALEVNRGAFDDWGVEVGDIIESNV